MKKVIIVLISILLLVLDNSVMPFIQIKSAFPSLLFVFAVGYSLVSSEGDALFVGVVSGMLQDIFFSYGFGLNSLINMIICLGVCYLGNGVFKNKKIVPIATIFIATIVKHLAVGIGLFMLNYNGDFSNMIYVAIYNSIIMFFSYRFILKFANSEDVNDKWRIR